MRLDKYLKVSRLIKRRSVANDACDNERVTVNGREAKASYQVKLGDVIEIAFGQRTLRVEVTQGQAVKSGQLLLVMEAMKMENEILASRDGTVAQILVQKGTSVDTGTPLLVLA